MGIIDYFRKKNSKKEEILTPDRIKNILYGEYKIYKLTDDDYNCLLEMIFKVCILKNCLLEDFKLLKCGQDSITFEVNDSIVKVTTCFYNTKLLSDYVSHSKFILKPNIELSCVIDNKVFTVLEFDKLNVKNIKNSDVFIMYIHLREDGYLWYDPRKSNLGKDSEGGLFLIDYGQLVYINDKDNAFIQNELSAHRQAFPEFDEAYNRRFMFIDNTVSKEKK